MSTDPHQKGLTEAIRGTNACLTGEAMVDLVEDHASRTGFKSFLWDLIDVVPATSPNPTLYFEVQIALDRPEKYFGVSMPFFGEAPTYCPGSVPTEVLRSLLTRMYAEVSAAEGEAQVRAEARRELVDELTSPTSWWEKLRPWAMGIVALLAAAVILQAVRR